MKIVDNFWTLADLLLVFYFTFPCNFKLRMNQIFPVPCFCYKDWHFVTLFQSKVGWWTDFCLVLSTISSFHPSSIEETANSLHIWESKHPLSSFLPSAQCAKAQSGAFAVTTLVSGFQSQSAAAPWCLKRPITSAAQVTRSYSWKKWWYHLRCALLTPADVYRNCTSHLKKQTNKNSQA